VGFKIDGEGRKDLGDSVSRGAAGAWGGWLGRGTGGRARCRGSGLKEAQRGFWGCSADRLGAGGGRGRTARWSGFAP